MGVTIYEQDKGLLQAQAATQTQETARKTGQGQLEEDRESREHTDGEGRDSAAAQTFAAT